MIMQSDDDLQFCLKIFSDCALSDQKFKEQKQIIEELSVLLKNDGSRKYSSKVGKRKKHFPKLFYTDFDEMINKTTMDKTISLSGKSVDIQLLDILNTANRRHNMYSLLMKEYRYVIALQVTFGLDISTPIDLINDLRKYENVDEIATNFPEFVKSNGVIFDVVYAIRTENYHKFFDVKNKTLCNTILICYKKSDDVFHVMFKLEKSENNSFGIRSLENPSLQIIKRFYYDNPDF